MEDFAIKNSETVNSIKLLKIQFSFKN